MNILIVFFVFLFNSAFIADVFGNYINYNIEYLDAPESFKPLQVTIKTQLDENGEFLALFPIGVVEADTDIGIEAISKGSGIFLMKGTPNQTFAFRYKFHIENPTKLLQWPVIEENFIKFTALTVLVTPDFKLDDEWDIYYSFNNLKDDFQLVTSFSPNEKSLPLKATMTQFRKSVFVGGTQLNHNIININQKPVSILYRGKLKRFSQDPSDFFKQIIQTHRDFRNDHDFEHYLVYFEEPECTGSGARPQAEHFFHSIIGLLSYCEENTNPEETPWVFSHELSHAWFGYKMSFDLESARDLIWFYEGFNDYYGLKLALKSGLMTKDQYLECLNTLIHTYYKSPIKTVSNDEIFNNQTDESSNTHYWLLALCRGHFWAYWLDNELSEKGLSLDDFIQNLLFEKTKPSEHFTKEMIYNRFNEYLGDDLWNAFREAIESGKEFEFNTLKNISPIIMKEEETFHYGFDYHASVKENLIKNVKPGSPEQLAGLKDGQRIIIPITQTKNKNEVVLGVVEDNEYKEIIFSPQREKIVLPQFVTNGTSG